MNYDDTLNELVATKAMGLALAKQGGCYFENSDGQLEIFYLFDGECMLEVLSTLGRCTIEIIPKPDGSTTYAVSVTEARVSASTSDLAESIGVAALRKAGVAESDIPEPPVGKGE